MSEAFTGRDVIALILNDPAEYERLLHSYTLLLGQRKLWWERVAEAERDGWKTCVRLAIAEVGVRSNIPPTILAGWLDTADLPLTRAKVLQVARERLQARG